MKLKELLVVINQVHIKYKTSVPKICGGIPRDKYMKRLDNVNDIDITTGDETIHMLATESFLELKKSNLIKNETSKDGHQSIIFGKSKIDFSSNFRLPDIDLYLHKYGIEVNDLNGEMLSRDFTCNALLLDFDLKNITDPTKRGFADIKRKMISTCLPPKITLSSNKNRVIRSIYLACKLDFDIDPSIVEYVSKNPKSLLFASDTGLSEKLNKAIDKDADKVVYYLDKMNLWDVVPITEKLYPYKANRV
jgi:hypothetical protein